MPFSHLQASTLANTPRTDGAGESMLAILAAERRADLLRDVAATRVAHLARGAATVTAQPGNAWRYRAGLLIIRFGSWLRGAQTFAPIGAERRDTFA